MPIYEYICKKCEHGFETIVLSDTTPECPKCKSKQLTKQLSVFSARGSENVEFECGEGGCGAQAGEEGPCGGCCGGGEMH